MPRPPPDQFEEVNARVDKGKVFSTDLGKGEVFSSGANKGKVFPGISVNFPLLIAVLRDVLGFKTR